MSASDANSNMATQELIAFPDLTGLRTTAPSRTREQSSGAKAGTDVFQSIITNIELSQLRSILPAQNQASSTDGHVLRALRLAWAISLYFSQAHEASVFGFAQYASSPQSGAFNREELRFEVDASKTCTLTLVELAKLLENKVDIGSTSEADTAILDASASDHDLPPLPKAVLLCAGAEGDKLRLDIYASGKVHSDDSAKYQLRQLESLLASFLSDKDGPAFSSTRFSEDQLAVDRSNFRILTDDIGPAGLEAERIEFQFERHVQLQPDAPALDFRYHLEDEPPEDTPDNVRLTYRELDGFANSVARALREAGVNGDSRATRDEIVALFMPKSPETYISILGVCKANATWCPLDVEWPAERQAALFKKCEARFILTSTDADDAKLDAMKLENVTILRADKIVQKARADEKLREPLSISRGPADQLAYLVWTSGTTGLPKAVGIQHSAAVQAMRALQRVVPYSDSIRYLQFSEYTFDLSIMDEFWTWGLGGAVCCGTRALLLDSLPALANATRSTHVILTPAVSAEIRREDIPTLEVLINGGEKLSQVVADEWSRNCCLLNLYGPAEATLIAMKRRVPERDEVKAPNIGVALPTTALALIDRHGEILPRGSIGELIIGGPQVAREYVNDPKKTAEKFIQHPLLGRCYRTGDLTRQLWSGELEYLGREDDQVKIDGVRIELLEINAAIKDCHEKVKDSDTMALPKPNNPDTVHIVNFSVVPSGPEQKDTTMLRTDAEAAGISRALREAAIQRLPSNMVPTHFIILSRFPKNSSAKIDRVAIKKALQDFNYVQWESKVAGEGDIEESPGKSTEELASIFSAALKAVYGIESDSAQAKSLMEELHRKGVGLAELAQGNDSASKGKRSEMEDLLRKFLAELCDIDPEAISRNTPLPALGLTSLKAMSLTRKLIAAGIKCSVLSVVRHNTLGSLSDFLESVSGNAKTPKSTRNSAIAAKEAEDRAQRPNSSSERSAVLTKLSDSYLPTISQHLRITREDAEAVLPCSLIQEGMLAESQRDSNAYWPYRKYELSSTDLHVERLVEAVKAVIQQTDILRTGFIDASEIDAVQEEELLPSRPNFLQVVHKQADVVVKELDIPDSEKYEDYVQRHSRQATHHNALSGWPPLAIWIASHKGHRSLVLHAHHALYDGVTFELFKGLLQESYANPSSKLQISQYGEALPHLLPTSKEESDERDAVWKAALNEFPRGLEPHFPDLRDEDTEVSTLLTTIRIGTTKWAALEEAAYRRDSTPRFLAQVAWARLLSLYSGQNDILLGESAAGRDKDPVLANVMGPVITTLPIPISFKDKTSTSDVFKQLHKFHDAVKAHQHVPLALVRSILEIPRHSSLFSGFFVFNNVPQQPDDSKGSQLGAFSDFGVFVEHDIALQVSLTSEDGLEFELNALSSKMSRVQLDVMARQYDELLAGLCQSSEEGEDAQSGDIVSCMSAESLSVGPVTAWADSSHDPSRNIASWISYWAERSRSAPALEFHENLDDDSSSTILTYADLDHASKHLAALLHAKYGRQTMIAVSLPRQPATYIALLAILRSGNIYLPIDEALPDERKRELLADSQAKCVITDSASARVHDSVEQVVVGTETNWTELGKSYPPAPELKESSDDLAFCLYTSGSTGKPKGCLLTVTNLSAAIEAFLDVIESNAPRSFEAGARYLARSAEAFDVHLKEVLLPLRIGGCIVTAPRSTILQDLGSAMQKLKPTHAAVVPSLFFTQGRRVTPADLPSLKVLIVGGEQIAGDIISSWGRQDKVVVLNAYGPTEATIGISMSRVRQTSLSSDVGPAFPGSQYLIMQESHGQLEPVLRGQVGELCIAGLQVGQGYLGQESAAFSRWKDQRIYRTGDLGRMGCENEVYYAGRADSSQVKIRGARLELDEVNTKLQELAGAPALVKTIVSKHREADNDRLIAFLQRNGVSSRDEHAEFDEETFELAQQLSSKARKALPAHMAPSLIIPVKAIPLAVVSGKVNVRALKALYENSSLRELRSSVSSTSRRSLNDVENIIAEEAQRTFARNFAFDPSTNLFEAGMDSLSAIRLSARLRKRGLKIGVASIMGATTLEELASSHDTPPGSSTKLRSEEDLNQACEKLSSKIDRQTQQKAKIVLPCMPLQSSLIALSKENPKARLYVGTFQVNINPDVDLAKLRKAWLETLARHEIYRTVFPDAGKTLAQVVLKSYDHESIWVEVATTDVEEEIDRAAVNVISTIASKPPIRLLCIKARKLVLLAHHAIYDGESVNKLLTEVSDQFSGRSVAAPAQFSEVVRQWYRSDPGDDAEEYWKSYLADYSLTFFPNLNGIRKEGQGPRKETQVQSRTSFATLKEAAQKVSVSPQSLVLSVFAKLLSGFTGEDDILFGLVLRGRSFEIAGIDDVQGPCVTTVPLFVRSTSRSSSELAKNIQSTTASLLSYQHQPLSKIARAIGASGSLFNTLFAFSTQTASSLAFGEKPQVTMDAEYDLAVEVEADAATGHVTLLANFRDNVLSEEQALVLLNALDISLQSLQRSPSWQDLDTSLLSISNHPPQSPKGQDDTFVARFQQHARSDQNKVAFVYGEQLTDLTTVTYGQLDERSTGFAKHLVGDKSSIIALYLPKSVELYVTLIAIWKAGKIYLPIDPSLPAERIRYMLECAQDVTVVTTDELRNTLPPSVSSILTLSTLETRPTREKVLPEPSLDRGAYLLFTSGSTGRPKGCLISQRALAAALLSWDKSIPASSSTRMLQLASIGFDVSLIEVCMPLARGFAFGAAPKEVLLEDLVSSFHQLGITCADLPAALASGMRKSDLPKLEWLMTGGDMMSEEALKEWAPQGQLINAWGPTEATIGNTLGFVAPNSTRNNIGKAYACSSVYILDASRRPAFKGGIGEIAIGGPQVGDGYVGRDDLTKERFVTLENGCKVYLTGDRGRLLVDGSVEFLGRAEQGQVKVNGQRIELDEISNALSQDSKIVEVETLYLQHPGFSSKQLVAFAATGSAAAESSKLALDDSQEAVVALRSALAQARERLAQYMIPPHIIALASRLPMTHNNKTDRKALQAFYEGIPTSEIRSIGSKLSNSSSDEQPLSTEARQFCEKFADLCEVSLTDITPSTSVYHLGIDSITAMMLVKSLNREGYQITVQDTLRCPTIFALARKVTGHSTNGHASPEDRVKSLAESEDVRSARRSLGSALGTSDLLLPCSPLQAGMLSQFVASEGKAYLLEHRFRTNQPADKIEKAWKAIVQRTDILRVTFHYVTGEEDATGSWYQALHEELRPDIERSRQEVNGNQQTSVESGREEEFLAHGPYRLLIEETSRADTLLRFTIHHALYDGVSLPMLFKDLDDQLNDKSPEARKQFAELVPYLLPNNDDVAYWVEALKDYQPGPPPASESSSSSSLVEAQRTIKISSAEAIRKCRDLGVSLQTVASLSFGKLLAETTGRSDVVFGQIFALRQTLPSAETVIGPAFNTVPIRITFDDAERTSAEQLRQIQTQNDEGRPHRGASLRDIIAATAKEGMQGDLIDALFDFGAHDSSSSELKSLTAVQDVDGDVFGQYSLNASFISKADALNLVLTARQGTTGASSLEDMANKYEAIFADMLHNAEAPVIRMPDDNKLAVHESKTSTRTRPKDTLAKEEKWTTSQEELVWKAIARAASLDADDLTRSTSLASIGLDSISAIGISSALRKKGVRLSAAQLLRGATLGRILESLSASSNQSNGHTLPKKSETNASGNAQRRGAAERLKIKEEDIEQILPVTPGQAWHIALWLKSGRRTNVFSFPLRTPARLAEEKLRQAWKHLVYRHQILRTTFVSFDGTVRQVVLAPGSITESFHVVSTGTSSDVKVVTKELMAEQAQVPENLFTPSVKLFWIQPQGSDPRGAVVLRLFHGLYDAMSLELIVSDLKSLCEGRDPSSDTGFNKVAEAVVTQSHSSQDAEFWSHALQGAEQTRFTPVYAGDAKHPSPPAYIFEQLAFNGARQAQKTLQARLGGNGVSLQNLFIAAVAASIGSRLKVVRPTMMVLHAGRTSASALMDRLSEDGSGEVDVNAVVGPTATLTPLCVSVSENSDPKGLLQATRTISSDLLDRLEREQTYLGDIYASSGSQASGPLTNVVLNMVWFSNATGEESKSASGSDDGKWSHFKVGEAVDFERASPFPRTEPHALDNLDLAAAEPRLGLDRMEAGLSIDVALNADGDSVGIAVLSNNGAVSTAEASKLVGDIVQRVKDVLASYP